MANYKDITNLEDIICWLNTDDYASTGYQIALGKALQVLDTLKDFSDRYPLAAECGGEMIWQNDDAQTDAIDLVGKIFDDLGGLR